MSNNRRPSNSASRTKNIRTQAPVFWIACQGAKTETSYIQGLQLRMGRKPKCILKVLDEVKGLDPGQLVRKAKNHLQQCEPNDQVWVVFDTEDATKQSASLPAALNILASTPRLQGAISNPCFELFLVWHFEDLNSYVSTDAAISRRHKLDGSSEKELNFRDDYAPKIPEALRRQQRTQKMHGGTPHWNEVHKVNPFSSFGDLVDAVEKI